MLVCQLPEGGARGGGGEVRRERERGRGSEREMGGGEKRELGRGGVIVRVRVRG